MPRRRSRSTTIPDTANISGLQQPSVNLGGLLSNSMSGGGDMGGMSGAGQGEGGGGGMTGGMDLAQILAMLGAEGGDVAAPGPGLGQPFTSLAQQQAMGQIGPGGIGQPYYTAGQSGQSAPGGMGAGSADPLAIAQKVLGLGAKAGSYIDQSVAQGSNTPTASPTTGGGPALPGLGGGPMGGGGAEPIDFQRLFEDPQYAGSIDWANYVNDNTPIPGLGGGPFQGGGGLSEAAADAAGSPLGGDAGGAGALGEGGGMFGGAGFGNTLGGLASALSAYQGFQNGDPFGAAGGIAGTGSQLASILGQSGLASGLGAIGGPLSLAQGAQTGNPMQLGSGLLQTYNSLATLGQMFPELGINLPSLSSLGGDAFAALAPETAAALGIGSGVGTVGLGAGITPALVAATPELAALGGAGTAGATGAAAGGVAAGAGAAGVVALPAAVLALGIIAAMNNLVGAPEKRLAMNVQDTAARRGALGGNINTVGQAMSATDLGDIANDSPEELAAKSKMLNDALAAEANVNWALQNNGSNAPSKIPRLDPTRIQGVQEAYHRNIVPAQAAIQDRYAELGVPLDQYFDPAGALDIYQLAGQGLKAPNAINVGSLTPEQLAGIGPGNMLAALNAIRTGGSLTGLPHPVEGVNEARLAQLHLANTLAQQARPEGSPDWSNGGPLLGGQNLSPYFFSPQQMSNLQNTISAQRVYDTNKGNELNYIQQPGVSPDELWQQMIAGYQIPQAPASMWGPLPPAQPAVAAPTAAPGGAVSPQQSLQQQPAAAGMTPQIQQALAALMMGGGRTPGFGAQGEDDLMAALRRFSQYGA